MRRTPITISAAVSALAIALAGPPALDAQDDWSAGLFAEARQLPLVAQSLTVRAGGGEAELVLIQVFTNDGPDLAQADFRLHLPADATVAGFGFWRGDRFLAAELKEREEAVHAHAAAATEGRATGILRREGAIHSYSVYPVAAGELQQVETTIRVPVVRERGRSHLALPIASLLGGAPVTSTALVQLDTDEPLSAFGVEGATQQLLDRGPHRARLAFAGERPVEVWWSEEAPPLLTRAEAVPLDDGSLAAQIRVVFNDAGGHEVPYRELVLVLDASFSMRRRAEAVADLVERAAGRASAPVRAIAVAERAIPLDPRDRAGLLAAIRGGEAGFAASWEDLAAEAAAAGCGDPAVRCVVVTDPQLEGLAADRGAGLETVLLADADELAHFAALAGGGALVHQPGIEAAAGLSALVDELVLPVLEIAAIEQRGGTLDVLGSPRLRVAEGGLLRLAATTRSTAPVELRLALGGREVTRTVEVEPVDAEGRQGRAIRRGVYRALLDGWMAEYRLHRDPEVRVRIVDTSVREGIPTELTALHVADPGAAFGGVLAHGATPAPLLRRLGLLALAAGLLALGLARRT